MAKTKYRFRVFRGTEDDAEFRTYEIKAEEGIVVLDAVHQIQEEHAVDMED